MKSSIFVKLGVFCTLIALALGLCQCKPEQPPKVEITVDDILGDPVKDATVRIYCQAGIQNQCTIDTTAVTNVAGFCDFNFELPAVLFVSASKDVSWTYYNADSTEIIDSVCTIYGESTVQLEMDVTTTETVVIYGCDDLE